ncbi:MAG TPA: sigma-70 family RNA polymerase sigma factor [Marmoricola sp.]
MDETTQLFEDNRTHLRAVAYRLLGSVHEADDAVQETWLRLERTDVSEVENLPAWLTTVVSRICLDQLRSRTARREDLDAEPDNGEATPPDPAAEAETADAVGRALMVVLDTLGPAERLAFCLHDLFGMSFDEIAPLLGRSSTACRQLASRARRRVRGQSEDVEVDRARQHEVVEAFMRASREGEFDQLLALLHPDAAVSADAAAAAMGTPSSITGKQAVAEFFSGRAKAARLGTLDGFTAATWSHRGELKVVFAFTVEDGLVREIEFLADVAPLDVGASRPIR